MISEPIGKDRHHSTRRMVSETGRTHQIRVHLSYIGHPIIGDTLYDARETESGDYELHAIQLEFDHPFLNDHIVVKDVIEK